jgi:predicted cupin superfamily sugar epimerase
VVHESSGRAPASADEVVAALGLSPHPEGGCFRESFRDRGAGGGRGAFTAIYYLLRRGERSAWHRIRDAAEIWHHYAGAPLDLRISADGRTVSHQRLGPGLGSGERPQALVPSGAWQSAVSCGEWTLVGCTVAPAFEFSAFELAPQGWEPGPAGASGGRQDGSPARDGSAEPGRRPARCHPPKRSTAASSCPLIRDRE